MTALTLLAAGGVDTEHRLVLVLTQLAVILLVARMFAGLFRRFGQPAVVGEIVAGLMLGPSVLGKLEATGFVPHVSAYVFDPSVAPVLQVMAQIGLVLLLFLIGLEFDFGHLKRRGRAAAAISAAGVVAPFGLAVALGVWMHPHVAAGIDRTAFVLFLGTAMSITALPILGRMMIEMNVSRTRVATVTITAAAIDDATGWTLLAAVSAVAAARFHAPAMAWMVGEIALFGLAMFYVVRPLALKWAARTMRHHDGRLGLGGLAVLLATLFACAIVTSTIGIFAIFGAFLFGAVLSGDRALRDAVHAMIGPFVTVFFLPIFFTYTGLRTDIGSLGTAGLWAFAGGVLAVAVAGKLGGCGLAARLSGLGGREALCVGVLMNTRALMELVVVNAGYDLGVIPKSVFCMLVIMAVVTTVMTTPILMRTMRGTELEPGIVSSGFARARR